MKTRLLCCAVLMLCGLLTGIVIAQSPAPLAVFVSPGDNTDLLISRVDTGLQTVETQVIQNVLEYPYAIQPNCTLFLPVKQDNQQKLLTVNLKTGEENYYLEEYSESGYAQWLPDGRHIWAQYDTGLLQIHRYAIIDTATGNIAPIVDLTSVTTRAPTEWIWSPDSRYGVLYSGIAIAGMYAYLLDLTTKVLTPLDITGNDVWVWSPDSRYLAMLDTASHIVVLDVQTMTQQRRNIGEIHFYGMAWTADNHLLFLARQFGTDPDYEGYRWHPETDTLEEIPIQLPADDLSVLFFTYSVWSPDRTSFFYEDASYTLHILDTVQGSERASLAALSTDGYRTHTWSPDSRYLLSYNASPERLVVTDTHSGQTHFLVPGIDWIEFDEFTRMWQTYSMPGMFDRQTGTLYRLIFTDGVPELRSEFTLPGAWMAALCDPEEMP